MTALLNSIKQIYYNNVFINSFALALGLPLAFVIEQVKSIAVNYQTLDLPFFFNLFVLIFIDTALGIWVAIKRKDLSSAGFSKVFTKITIYLLFLLATHSASTFGAKNHFSLLSWIDSIVYSMIAAREYLSIIEKIGILMFFTGLDKLKKHIAKVANLSGLGAILKEVASETEKIEKNNIENEKKVG